MGLLANVRLRVRVSNLKSAADFPYAEGPEIRLVL